MSLRYFKAVLSLFTFIVVTSSAFANSSPSYDEFMDKAMLVHVGQPHIDLNTGVVSIRGYAPFTYFSMNSAVVDDQFFRKHGRSSCVILTPLRKNVENIISVCAHEVVYVGDMILGEGDTVIFQKQSTRETYYTAEEKESHVPGQFFRPLVDTQADPFQCGVKQFYTSEEIELLKNSGLDLRFDFDPQGYSTPAEESWREARQKVYDVLREKEQWVFGYEDNFWTHQTPFELSGEKITNQSLFFKALFERHPNISFGYEFYSQNGFFSLTRLLSDLCDEDAELPEDRSLAHDIASFYKQTFTERFLAGPLDAQRKEECLRKIQTINFCVDDSEDDSSEMSEEEVSLFDFLLEQILPQSPEIFALFERAFSNYPQVQDMWPTLKLAYQVSEAHRNGEEILSNIKEKKLSLYNKLSSDQRRQLYFVATGFDVIHKLDFGGDQEKYRLDDSNAPMFKDFKADRVAMDSVCKELNALRFELHNVTGQTTHTKDSLEQQIEACNKKYQELSSEFSEASFKAFTDYEVAIDAYFDEHYVKEWFLGDESRFACTADVSTCS